MPKSGGDKSFVKGTWIGTYENISSYYELPKEENTKWVEINFEVIFIFFPPHFPLDFSSILSRLILSCAYFCTSEIEKKAKAL